MYFTCKDLARNVYCSDRAYKKHSHNLQQAWIDRVIASQHLQANQIIGISMVENQLRGAIIVA